LGLEGIKAIPMKDHLFLAPAQDHLRDFDLDDVNEIIGDMGFRTESGERNAC